MTGHELILGAAHWLGWAAALAGVSLAMLVWSYLRAGVLSWPRTLAALLKSAALVALAACLVEPRLTGERPRPGSNLFLIVADDSRSLQLADGKGRASRSREMLARLDPKSPWLTRLSQDFDVRRYAFEQSLRPIKDFENLKHEGQASALTGALAALRDRFADRPVAGILLFTDGNATDVADYRHGWSGLPPVYPVVIGEESEIVDLSLSRVTVSQSNFETAPVTITAELAGQGLADRAVVVRVVDEEGHEVERQAIASFREDQPPVQRFLLRPDKPGISFYTVHASLAGEERLAETPEKSIEATLANNRRIAVVDRGGGPYRVLYVSGRPNWEFKFLRRALAEDDDLNLVGLVRIAKREPKFKFLGRSGERTNPLFRGFGNQHDEQAEQYDQPVLLRLGTDDADELRGGFPQSVEEMFRYHAVILDEIEAAFFTQDQQSLLQQFVSRRGGGFLMLGGKDSFGDGGYQRTAIGDMLPVYPDRLAAPPSGTTYRQRLTREGLLQPWVRLRTNEADERARLASMPDFKTVNRVGAIKPGATVLAEVESSDGGVWPALVAHQYGRGRPAALLVGDLWRWHLGRDAGADSDLDKSWRQTVRWLVADVPKPVEIETRPTVGELPPATKIIVRARDRQFEPLDNAAVTLAVKLPDGKEVELTADASDKTAGEYVATFVPRFPGAYRAKVSVVAADGSHVGEREAGWAVEPETEELRTLTPNRALLARLAEESAGEVVPLDDLAGFVESLPNRRVPVVETWTYPLWHQWSVFLTAIVCLVGEWALRRWKGLP